MPRLLLNVNKKLEHRLEDEQVRRGRAQQEQPQAERQEQVDVFLLVRIQSRRDERPDLIEDPRARNDRAHDQRRLQPDREHLGKAEALGVDAIIFGARMKQQNRREPAGDLRAADSLACRLLVGRRQRRRGQRIGGRRRCAASIRLAAPPAACRSIAG